jgi:hypothetical protein
MGAADLLVSKHPSFNDRGECDCSGEECSAINLHGSRRDIFVQSDDHGPVSVVLLRTFGDALTIRRNRTYGKLGHSFFQLKPLGVETGQTRQPEKNILRTGNKWGTMFHQIAAFYPRLSIIAIRLSR